MNASSSISTPDTLIPANECATLLGMDATFQLEWVVIDDRDYVCLGDMLALARERNRAANDREREAAAGRAWASALVADLVDGKIDEVGVAAAFNERVEALREQ